MKYNFILIVFFIVFFFILHKKTKASDFLWSRLTFIDLTCDYRPVFVDDGRVCVHAAGMSFPLTNLPNMTGWWRMVM